MTKRVLFRNMLCKQNILMYDMLRVCNVVRMCACCLEHCALVVGGYVCTPGGVAQDCSAYSTCMIT